MKEEQLKLDEIVKEFEELIDENHSRQDASKRIIIMILILWLVI